MRMGNLTTQRRACNHAPTAHELANALFKNAPSSERFGCPLCHAKYSVVRRQSAPGIIPTCEDCDQDFPPTENGEWLIYEREDA
jgi:hypothetical protein